MKTAFILLFLLSSCSTTQVKESVGIDFVNAFIEAKGTRLVIRFTPEIPPSQMTRVPEKKKIEIRWKASAKESSTKQYSLGSRESGLRQATLSVDSASESILLLLVEDPPDSFGLLTEKGTDFVVTDRLEVERQLATKESRRKKVTLNVKNAPLDKLLRTIAADSEKSLVLPNTVTGAVTVNLQNIPYEQAIDMLLRPTVYRAEHAGDITIIRSAKDDRAFKAVTLHHVDAGLLQKTVSDILTKEGQVSVDPNTNSIFVVDKVESVKQVELMLAQMDQEPRQVEVETAIIQVNNNKGISFGVDFSRSGAGTLQTVRSNKLSALDPTNTNQQGVYVGLSWQNVSALVGMLATNSKLDVLAKPRIVALSDQDANIILGSKLGYKTLTSTSTGQVIESVNFLTVGTQLHIKPHVTENNDILMYLKPEVSDGTVDPKTLLPSANTTSAETKILTRSGQTIVIGGLFRERLEKNVAKVPLLGDLPLIGLLFGAVSETAVKTEVIILLSPKLVTTQLYTAYAREASEATDYFYKDSGLSRSEK